MFNRDDDDNDGTIIQEDQNAVDASEFEHELTERA